MTLLEKMCEELRVEIGEVWRGDDGSYYKITPNGRLWKVEYVDNLEEDIYERVDEIRRVLLGELKPVWKPINGESYYIPAPHLEAMWNITSWANYSDYDNKMWERGLVYKTKEEAISCSREMIAKARFYKEQRM